MERFLSRGVRRNKKIFSKIFLIYKSLTLALIVFSLLLKNKIYKYQHNTEGRVGNRLLLEASVRGLVNLHKNFPFSQGYIQCCTYVHIYQTIQNEGQISNQNIESADKPKPLLLWIVHTQNFIEEIILNHEIYKGR